MFVETNRITERGNGQMQEICSRQVREFGNPVARDLKQFTTTKPNDDRVVTLRIGGGARSRRHFRRFSTAP